MEPFEGLDFYDVESLLTEEEIMVRDMVREWVDEAVIPKIEHACEKGVFLDEWRVALGEMGVLGAPLKGYGCPGLSYVAYGLICQELERGDSGLRSFASVQGSLAMYPIWDFGTEEQKEKYLPKMASGEWVGCFGLTEPDYGSNPGDMVTKAEDKGDHYLLNGAKMWITNGTIADVAVVWAKLDGVIRGFIVEKNDEGFSAPEMKGKHSLKASVTSELVFQDCKIPKDRMLPGVKGLRGPFSCLNNARYGISWGRSVRPWPATTARRPTRSLASSSITPSLPTNSSKTSWRGCFVKSPKGNSLLTTSVRKRTTGRGSPNKSRLPK